MPAEREVLSQLHTAFWQLNETLSQQIDSIDSVVGASARPFADFISDFISDHAPAVVDIVASVSEQRIVFIAFPDPLFPDFSTASAELMVARRSYYVYLGIEGLGACLVVGVLLTAARNYVCEPKLPSKDRAGELRLSVLGAGTPPGYQPVTPIAVSSEKILQQLLHSRVVLAIVLFSQTGILLSIAMTCVMQGTMNERMGLGFEYWAVWSGMHFGGALIELIASGCREGRLDWKTYPEKAGFTGLPLLSEKYDTAKDVVLSAVSLSRGEPVCAILNVIVLLTSQVYFLATSEVKAELTEAYLPVLTAPLAPYQEEVPRDSRPFCERLFAQLMQVLLKQASPARRTMCLAEDLPQACISIYLAAVKKASWFCVMSLMLTSVRLCLATDVISKEIRRLGSSQLRTQRRLAVRGGNTSLVVSLTKQLWSVEAEGFEELTEADYGSLAQMLAKTDLKKLNYKTITDPCRILLLLSSSLRRDSDGAFEDVVNEMNIDINKKNLVTRMTLAHYAAEVGDGKCLEKLRQCGANIFEATGSGRAGFDEERKRPSLSRGKGPRYETFREGARIALGCNVTAMHIAATRGHISCIQKLHELGWPEHSHAYTGRNSPLAWAAAHGKGESIRTLLALGEGSVEVAIEVATQHDQQDVIVALREHAVLLTSEHTSSCNVQHSVDP
eukprot:TRINITY_DN121317_c0_g1_i1.p1 TRINITY_DN121317_c0_g1~~TRINITY_DN121317_c0_g1_i1.p1  ORF type:complete len:673 (-),score=75.40 TRINITY_DN121317_c0_g1_i1:625-2643(-)